VRQIGDTQGRVPDGLLKLRRSSSFRARGASVTAQARISGVDVGGEVLWCQSAVRENYRDLVPNFSLRRRRPSASGRLPDADAPIVGRSCEPLQAPPRHCETPIDCLDFCWKK